jgi:hypothetical protein
MSLTSVLEEFDTLEKKKFSESDFSRALSRSLPSDVTEVPFEIKAESIAFELAERPKDEESAWGKY